MPTSCNTHDYDGKLREKWFEMRSMLIKEYLPNCLSFDDTIKEMEEWLNKKYFNVKRIGRARRSINILTSQRKSNFDSRNDINVEELLPILWNKVKNQEDIHDTFYEQLCDITGGSCSQGRSTRLFQFLFLFDLPTQPAITTSNRDEKQDKTEITTNEESITKDLADTTLDNNTDLTFEDKQIQQCSEELESNVVQSTEGEEQLQKEVEVNDGEQKNLSSDTAE